MYIEAEFQIVNHDASWHLTFVLFSFKENLERYVEFMTEVMYLISSSDNRTYIKQEMRKVCELEVAVGKVNFIF